MVEKDIPSLVTKTSSQTVNQPGSVRSRTKHFQLRVWRLFVTAVTEKMNFNVHTVARGRGIGIANLLFT